ncbi:hypothetical protein D9M71_777050 [compost metagenome]
MESALLLDAPETIAKLTTAKPTMEVQRSCFEQLITDSQSTIRITQRFFFQGKKAHQGERALAIWDASNHVIKRLVLLGLEQAFQVEQYERRRPKLA